MTLKHVSLLVMAVSVMNFACSPRGEKKESTVQIQLPSSRGVLAAPPTGRSSCYAINVMAPDLPSQAAVSCLPATGLSLPFSPEGATLSMLIPMGSDRVFEVYLLLKADGDTSPCEPLGLADPALNAEQIYKVAVAGPLVLDQPEMSLSIKASFPGEAEHLAKLNSGNGTCTWTAPEVTPTPTPTPTATPTPGPVKMQTSGKELSGTHFKIQTGAPSSPKQQGGQFKISPQQ